jgi:hypothetical protein
MRVSTAETLDSPWALLYTLATRYDALLKREYSSRNVAEAIWNFSLAVTQSFATRIATRGRRDARVTS